MSTKDMQLTPDEKEYAECFIKGFTENFTRTYQESLAKIKTLDMPEDKRQEILIGMEEKFNERLQTSLKESLIKALARRSIESKEE